MNENETSQQKMNKLKNKMRKTMICQVQLFFQYLKDKNTI